MINGGVIEISSSHEIQFLFILNGTKWFFFIIYSNNVLFVTIIPRI